MNNKPKLGDVILYKDKRGTFVHAFPLSSDKAHEFFIGIAFPGIYKEFINPNLLLLENYNNLSVWAVIDAQT